MIHLLNANALHIPLADGCVQCVITSPPYWGLRDYGTAEWVGGDAGCDHKRKLACNDGGRANVNGFHGSMAPDSDKGEINYTGTCPKCGAIRKDAQLGLETTPAEYLANMVAVFREVRRVLADDGVIWVNMGDSYTAQQGKGWSPNGGKQEPAVGTEKRKLDLPPKNLVGIPWRLAFALQDDGWILRSDIIWHKPNPMPESATDRPTKAHEYVFLLAKQGRYFYDAEAIRTPSNSKWKSKGGSLLNRTGWTNDAGRTDMTRKEGSSADEATRNRRTVWTVATQPYSGAHFATFPTALVEPMVLAGSRPGDLVMDPFSGTATVGTVALKHHRCYVGLELNPEYIELAKERTRTIQPTLFNMGAL